MDSPQGGLYIINITSPLIYLTENNKKTNIYGTIFLVTLTLHTCLSVSVFITTNLPSDIVTLLVVQLTIHMHTAHLYVSIQNIHTLIAH